MTHPYKIFKSYPVYICDFPSHVVFLGLLNYFQHCWWFHNTVVLFICTCVPSMCPKCAPVCQKYSIFNVKFSFSGKTCNVVRIGCVGLAKICCVPAHNGASVHSDSLIPRKENQGTKYNNNVEKKSLVPRHRALTPLTTINTEVLVKLVKHKSVNSQKKVWNKTAAVLEVDQRCTRRRPWMGNCPNLEI